MEGACEKSAHVPQIQNYTGYSFDAPSQAWFQVQPGCLKIPSKVLEGRDYRSTQQIQRQFSCDRKLPLLAQSPYFFAWEESNILHLEVFLCRPLGSKGGEWLLNGKNSLMPLCIPRSSRQLGGIAYGDFLALLVESILISKGYTCFIGFRMPPN